MPEVRKCIVGVVPAAPLLALLDFVGQARHTWRASRLEAPSSSFWNRLLRNATIKWVATGFGFTKGLIWDPPRFFWGSDRTLNQTFRVNAVTEAKRAINSLGDPGDKQPMLLNSASVFHLERIAVWRGVDYFSGVE